MSNEKKLDAELVKKLEKQMLRRLTALNEELDEDEKVFEDTLPADSKEAAPMREELEIVRADNARDADEIDDIRKAIRNIHSGDYGNCEKCNESISVDRLLAMPQALQCIKCQQLEERENK